MKKLLNLKRNCEKQKNRKEFDMKKPFTITITDNHTGTTETHDTNSLFAVIGNEESVHEVRKLDCNGLETAALLAGVHDLFEKSKRQYAMEWIGAKIMLQKEKEMAGETNE